ncbi:hypothetical protein [Phycicoccus sp. HDW14]|uniref:hypothetical protein n=1 Tax=Phycicoccus sp. HDW14 TaxID=2714941 RepID=UPI00197B670C|nr:hypothetical protein [Phycicoccus sp. HDW14]
MSVPPTASPDHEPPVGRPHRLADSARAVGRGGAASAKAVGRGGAASARAVGRGGRAAGRRFRRFAAADGAADTGLARLTELHAVNVAGDAAVTVSLAGTVFAMPTDEARGRVALFLLLTMAPFLLLAPLIGPLLDRFRHGRRWALGTTLATRGFLAWVLASAVLEDSVWLFPAALGCLVASRSYAVARAAAVPRLLPADIGLVSANSRLNIAGIVGMVLGGGVAGAASRIGPDWSLRVAFAIFVAATVLAIRLPARVDSSVGEVDVDGTPRARSRSTTPSGASGGCGPCRSPSATSSGSRPGPACSRGSSPSSSPSSCASTRCPASAARSSSGWPRGRPGSATRSGPSSATARTPRRPRRWRRSSR